MGWASEQMIEQHNLLMETDEEYADECRRHWAEEDEWREWASEQHDKFHLFDDYRIDHTGYEEFDEAVLSDQFVDDDLPF